VGVTRSRRSNTGFTSPRQHRGMQRRQLILAGALAAALPRAQATTDDTQWIDTARRRELPLRLRWPEGDAPCALVLHSHGLGAR
jgi:hypothetical protein